MYLVDLYLKPTDYVTAHDFMMNLGFDVEAYMRKKMCKRYSFAVPCTEAIEIINDFGTILEIGAGTGLWASHLKDCIATDPKRGLPDDPNFFTEQHTEVIMCDGLEARSCWPDRTIFMCWPNMEDWPLEVIKNMAVGQCLIYIGEDKGGCTATPEFHDFIKENFVRVTGCCIPTWAIIHDSLSVYERVK